jgi:hypothetical protein
MPEGEDERSIIPPMQMKFDGQCNGTRPTVVARGARQKLQALRSTSTNHSRRNTMSHIYNFFENHGEVWGAVFFGVLAIGACVAMAAALNGAM